VTGPARLAVGAAVSALAGDAGGLPAAILLAALVLALAVVGRGRHGPAGRLLPLAVGALLICGRLLLGGSPDTPQALPSGSGPWVAIVESVGSPKGGTRPAVVVLQQPPGVRLAATLPWYPEVEPGDAIRIDGAPEAPPTGDGYASYLDRIGAAGSIRARSLELVQLDGSREGPTWERLRSTAADGLQRAMPEPEAGLAAGILVGLRDRVDRDLAAAFTTAGVSHIVAISGWNIAIVATTLGALTGRLGRRRRTIATGLAIATYVAFVGPSPSVVRAAAMAGCALVARELGRPTGALSAMGLAVTALLLLEPGNVNDPGFQLSVLATAGLISWGTGLARRLGGSSPGPLRAWLAESLGVSLAAQAATLPAILLDFGRLSLVSPAVNLLVAPLVAPAMAAGGVALIGGLITVAGAPSGVAILAGLPAWALLGVLIALVRAGAGLPFASLTLEPPGNVLAAAVSAGTLLGVVSERSPLWRVLGRARRRRPPSRPAMALAPAGRRGTASGRGGMDRQRRILAVGLGAATLAIGLAAAHRPDGATRITVLDVGQGDSILVEGGGGSRLLVDGGPDPGRLRVALDQRLPPWDRRIDEIVLTHPHEDHVAGLPQLLARYHVARVFEPGMIGPGPGYAAWLAALAGGEPARWALGTGDRLALDGISFRVLWPDPGGVPLHPADGGTAINNVSIVLLGEVGGQRFLLTGDIEQAVEPQLLARGLPSVELLKVAHHGSATSSTEPFLETARPGVAVVSVGAGNPYGHPAAATMSRLERNAARVFRTDLEGSVTVTFDAAGMHARASGPRPLAGVPAGGKATPDPVPEAATWPAVPATAALQLHHPAPLGQPWLSPRYHRADDGPVPRGGGAPAPLARSTGVAPATLARRRRDRRVAGPAGRAARRRPRRLPGPAPPRAGPREPRRSTTGRGSGAAPRRGQGGAAARPWRCAPWGGGRLVAREPRPSRAG
jgi:competence protein ComEC